MKRSATVGSAEQGEILFSMDGVQVFHVSASGEVTTPSYPDTLHLVKFDREKKRNGAQLPPALRPGGRMDLSFGEGEESYP
jgi:hypothetical protein